MTKPNVQPIGEDYDTALESLVRAASGLVGLVNNIVTKYPETRNFVLQYQDPLNAAIITIDQWRDYLEIRD